MSVYAGIDLHSNNSVLAVMDEGGQALLQCRRANDLSRILADFEPYREDLNAIAVESTYNWYWLVDGLMEHGYDVRLLNTAAIPQYSGLKHGNDHTDALHLAQLLRLGLLPEGYIYPREQRALRDLMRRRFTLVRQAVQLLLTIQSSFSRTSGKQISANVLKRMSPAELQALFSDPNTRCGALAQYTVWLTVHEQIRKIEQQLSTQLLHTPEFTRLRSVPGIGPILGMTIMLEAGPIERFASVADYASYCRMVESVRLSNGKKKGHGNRKCGNRYLCWVYMEAANYATRYSPLIRHWYERKRSSKHRVVAIKAVAHKLARACYHLLKDGTEFDPKRALG